MGYISIAWSNRLQTNDARDYSPAARAEMVSASDTRYWRSRTQESTRGLVANKFV